MPVPEGLRGPDEPPHPGLWGPLRTPPIGCGGLSLALELPALVRQLRAAWRARRGGPRGPGGSHTGTRGESDKEEVEEVRRDVEDRIAHVEGN